MEGASGSKAPESPPSSLVSGSHISIAMLLPQCPPLRRDRQPCLKVSPEPRRASELTRPAAPELPPCSSSVCPERPRSLFPFETSETLLSETTTRKTFCVRRNSMKHRTDRALQLPGEFGAGADPASGLRSSGARALSPAVVSCRRLRLPLCRSGSFLRVGDGVEPASRPHLLPRSLRADTRRPRGQGWRRRPRGWEGTWTRQVPLRAG